MKLAIIMRLPHHLHGMISSYYCTASLILFNYWLKPLVNQEVFSKSLCATWQLYFYFQKKESFNELSQILSFMHHCMPAFLYLDILCRKYMVCCFFALYAYVSAVTLLDMCPVIFSEDFIIGLFFCWLLTY